MGRLAEEGFGGVSAEDVAAEELAGFGVGDEFDESIGLPLREGFADGGEGEAAHSDGDAARFGLCFGEADGGNLGMRRANGGHIPTGAGADDGEVIM